ncbi:hypothetical protein NL676_032778 [Syzygium grande]|nr:hypothetical protein NL676_032778 [Syzygium grande]
MLTCPNRRASAAKSAAHGISSVARAGGWGRGKIFWSTRWLAGSRIVSFRRRRFSSHESQTLTGGGMGEEAKMSEHGDPGGSGGGGGVGGGDGESDGEDRVVEWEFGLPSCDDLAPLCQALIPPELASAFSIALEPSRTAVDVNRASRSTLTGLRGSGAASQGFSTSDNFKSFVDNHRSMGVEEEEEEEEGADESDSRKSRRIEMAEEVDSTPRMDNSREDPSGSTLKRPRLVWTPQLHKRFVDVVAHLGIKNAVPKTIMQLMNVEGLTRENVASHLQKYRLYLKRMHGMSCEGPSSSDQLFASTTVPHGLNDVAGQ